MGDYHSDNPTNSRKDGGTLRKLNPDVVTSCDESSGSKFNEVESGGIDGKGAGIEEKGAGIKEKGAGIDGKGAGSEEKGAGSEEKGARIEKKGAGIEEKGAGIDGKGAGIEEKGAGIDGKGAGIEEKGFRMEEGAGIGNTDFNQMPVSEIDAQVSPRLVSLGFATEDRPQISSMTDSMTLADDSMTLADDSMTLADDSMQSSLRASLPKEKGSRGIAEDGKLSRDHTSVHNLTPAPHSSSASKEGNIRHGGYHTFPHVQ